MTNTARLSKRVIEAIGCSRREAELYIENGWVLVDGKRVELPQFKVDQQRVELHPDAVLTPVEPVTILLNAPSGYSPSDATMDVNIDTHWQEDKSGIRYLQRHFRRLEPCIPLQDGANGIHVLTQDWRIKRTLTGHLSRFEQEYVVEVAGTLSESQLKRLNHVLKYKDKELPLAKVSRQNETCLRFAINDPKPGQIHFMCIKAGLKIKGMKRIRIGRVALSRVPPGQWRYLAPKERF